MASTEPAGFLRWKLIPYLISRHTHLILLIVAGITISAVLQRVFLPVVLTGLTTATGFLSLTLSPLVAIKEFGIFSVIGVCYAVLVTLTYTPSILKLIHCKPQKASRAGKQQSVWFDRFAQSVAQFDIRYRRPIFVAFALTFIFAVTGMSKIRVGMEHITNFRQDSPVRRAYEEANAQLGGANLFYVVIETGHREAVKEPVNLKAIKELQLWLNAQPEIGGSLSIVDYLQLLNSAFHDNEPEYHLIPDTRKEVGQLLFFGASDEVEQQDTIPLFKGLSSFQARIVARMASIRVVSAGERIITIGEPGIEMYAVIDGKLQASKRLG